MRRDSKALNDLNDKHKPYGENISIDKLDSVNHVNHVGKALQNIRKTSSIVKGGAGKLTDVTINKLTDYYRSAIRKNTTSSNDPKVILQLRNRKTDILAGLYHSVKNDDPAEQHKYCDIEWCRYLEDQRDGTTLFKGNLSVSASCLLMF